jgi:hypothetical protein
MGNHIYLTLLGLQRRKNTIFIIYFLFAAIQRNSERAVCKTLESAVLNLFWYSIFNTLSVHYRTYFSDS